MAKVEYNAVGRRKTAIARVRLVAGDGKILVNKRELDNYFGLETLKMTSKPVIAFKIFAGGQMFLGKTQEEKQQLIKGAYEEVFSALKPNDLAAVGVFQRDSDQLKENMDLYNQWYAERQA